MSITVRFGRTNSLKIDKDFRHLRPKNRKSNQNNLLTDFGETNFVPQYDRNLILANLILTGNTIFKKEKWEKKVTLRFAQVCRDDKHPKTRGNATMMRQTDFAERKIRNRIKESAALWWQWKPCLTDS